MEPEDIWDNTRVIPGKKTSGFHPRGAPKAAGRVGLALTPPSPLKPPPTPHIPQPNPKSPQIPDLPAQVGFFFSREFDPRRGSGPGPGGLSSAAPALEHSQVSAGTNAGTPWNSCPPAPGRAPRAKNRSFGRKRGILGLWGRCAGFVLPGGRLARPDPSPPRGMRIPEFFSDCLDPTQRPESRAGSPEIRGS